MPWRADFFAATQITTSPVSQRGDQSRFIAGQESNVRTAAGQGCSALLPRPLPARPNGTNLGVYKRVLICRNSKRHQGIRSEDSLCTPTRNAAASTIGRDAGNNGSLPI